MYLTTLYTAWAFSKSTFLNIFYKMYMLVGTIVQYFFYIYVSYCKKMYRQYQSTINSVDQNKTIQNEYIYVYRLGCYERRLIITIGKQLHFRIFVCTSWTLIQQKTILIQHIDCKTNLELTKLNHTTWFPYTVSNACILEDNILCKLLCSTFELNVDFEC